MPYIAIASGCRADHSQENGKFKEKTKESAACFK
jgi:hypothetical protein